MTTVATQAELVAAVPLMKSGDTLTCVGDFVNFPLKTRVDNIAFDCTKARFSGDTYTKNLNGFHVLGGTFGGVNPLRVDGGSDIAVEGALLLGPPERLGNAMSVSAIKGLKVSGAVKNFKNGLVATDVEGFTLTKLAFEGMRLDGIQGVAMRSGRFSEVTVHGTRRLANDHSDALQLRNLSTLPPCADIVVEDCEFVGDTQGLDLTHKTGDGDFKNLTVRRVRTNVAWGNGIALLAVKGLTVDDCRVVTYPLAANQSRLYVAADCTDVRWAGLPSSYAPYGNKPGWSSAGTAP